MTPAHGWYTHHPSLRSCVDLEIVASDARPRTFAVTRRIGELMTTFPLPPPIEPMLARLAESLPTGDGFLYEPKWDGFRAIVFRGGEDVYIQSRDLRPLDRYFPELHDALLTELPDGCVL